MEPRDIETVVLVRDLLFSSRIRSVATDAQIAIRQVREPFKLATVKGKRLIVDLNAAGFLEAAGEWKRRTGGEVIGFVSHVDETTIARARELGIDQVMSNGGFTAQLPNLFGAR